MLEEFTEDDFGDDSRFVVDQRGFVAIILEMVQNVKESGAKINLKTIVKAIDSDKCTVSTADAQYEADFIVCTVSIGVLRSQLIEFTPPLPSWKVSAIESVDMAIYMKVFCAFD